MDSRARAIPSRLPARKPTPIKGREAAPPFSKIGVIPLSKGEVTTAKTIPSLGNSLPKREITSPSQRTISSLTNSFSKLSTTATTTTRKPLDPPKSKVESAKRVTATPVKASPVKKAAEKPQPLRATAPPDPSFVPCSNCSRYFDPTRIGLHEKICSQTTVKKRKPFDAVKHRLQGTEAESYLRKPKSSVAHTNTHNDKAKKNAWRKKHEEFISIVRAAREAQAHVARGGKLSDLPPPPAMTTEELIPCPHCGRKFNDAAAERHIPKCANIKNRPKPVPKAVPKKR